MAWFVERLLVNSEKIRIKGFHSEMFEYLITLEAKIKEVTERGYLSEEELGLIEDLRYNKTITQIAKENDTSRVTVSTKIDSITDKLSMYLGGIYTDEGYLEYMKKKYKLNENQVDALRKKIKSKYKRFYLR